MTVIYEPPGPAKAKPCEPPVECPHGQISPLYMTCAYPILAGIPSPDFDFNAKEWRGRIPALGFHLSKRCVEQFDHNGVVQPL
jgi:hypothetical protein